MQFISKMSVHKSFYLFFIIFVLITTNTFAKVSRHHSDAELKKQTQANIANDNTSGEDLEIRRAAIKALGNRAGTIVVMHAQTGRIYTIVNQKWAIEDGFKPCSTIKLVTGVAGYNESLIQKNGNLSRGVYRLNLDQALAYSNNIYFQKVGKHLGSKKMIYYARELGLGEPTGINASDEFAGKLPYGNENLRIYSHADDFLVTPLQLSVMVSALSNGGRVLIPRIPNSNREKVRFKGFYRDNLSFNERIYERVIPGMMGAVKYGTAGRINNANLNIAGKTGSCISRKTWVGLFASVAPIQNPKYSVVVILRGRSARGKYSAAIAEKVYQALRPKYDDRFDRNLAYQPVTVSPNSSNLGETTAKSNEPIIVKSPKKTVKTNSKPIRNTVITYRRDPDTIDDKKTEPKTQATKKSKPPKKDAKELFPTIVIDGKTEITRPRVVQK